jgi:tetratricopeptide (TPR) repeat protein
MPGRVLAEALDLGADAPSAEERTLATYEAAPPGELAARAPAGDASVDPQILERLRSLGYLDTQSPRGDRNLAALHFEAGRYAEAAQAYAELAEENPTDAALRASLAGALGALGRFDESLAQLDLAIQLDPLNPEAYHNRGVIYERQGKAEEAAREYETALRYNPQYDPSRQALLRLTGTARPDRPPTPAEQLATSLAEQARQDALRGDYPAAMRQLDEAARVAPELARIYQYRSNVAFLMDDYSGAIAALRRALEIEPDNALFRTNLERLEKQAAERSAEGSPAKAEAPPRPPSTP